MRRFYLLFACLLAICGAVDAATKYVGGDISLLTKYEERGAIYYNENGTRITNMLSYLKDTGFNAMRVRLFVDPSMADAEDQGEGVCQDLPFVLTCCLTFITVTRGPIPASTPRPHHGP